MENTENAAPPVDFERLREVSDDDAELVKELIELYFSQTREHLTELKAAVSENNFDIIYNIAHKIAGGSLTCGMNEIVPSIRELEQSGRNQTADNTENLFEQAQAAFQKMQEYLETNKENLFS